MRERENILGYGITAQPAPACLDEMFAAICRRERQTWVACMNPHSYAVALDDKTFARALSTADWLVPDGVGILLASRFLRGSIRERVTGSDVFHGLHQRMNAIGGLSVFFLGATDETLQAIRNRMAVEYPCISVAGTYSPPFKHSYSDAEVHAMIAAINAASPDVLWVGMTAPKQEKWIADNLTRLNVSFAGAIGAVFDFYVRRVKRPHPIFQRLGLEWLPRLLQEPSRLWRRMFVSAPIFVLHVLRAVLYRY